jgi:hypothetical protein
MKNPTNIHRGLTSFFETFNSKPALLIFAVLSDFGIEKTDYFAIFDASVEDKGTLLASVLLELSLNLFSHLKYVLPFLFVSWN